MKKIFAMILALCMVLALAACGAPKTAEYKLGMGVVVSTASSSSEKQLAQVDATVAAVVLDKDGKIVACKIDVAQNKMGVADGQPVPKTDVFQTKVELKEAYDMKKASAIGLEWYEQAANFEKYVIGKTGAEVAAIETVQDGSHTVAVDETLKASCSMSIGDFIEAIAKACNDEQGKSFQSDGNFKLGLAAMTNDESVAPTEEKDGSARMYTNFAAVVVGTDGKILADLQDAIQPKIAFTAAGEIGETDYKGTKRELKEGYDMKKASAIGLEWYEQAANFTDAMVGKTAAEVGALELVEDGSHTVFADETLKASCSISVKDMIDVLLRAIDYAA